MGRVIHFEITAADTQRAKKFYELFGWNISDSGIQGLDYWLADTGNGADGINGGIMSKDYAEQPTIIWIEVDDLNIAIDKVKAAGGELAGEKQSVPNIGDTIYIKDTEGNRVGLVQPLT